MKANKSLEASGSSSASSDIPLASDCQQTQGRGHGRSCGLAEQAQVLTHDERAKTRERVTVLLEISNEPQLETSA